MVERVFLPSKAKWGFDRGLVDPKWDWFWDMAVFAAPIWEGGGSVYDFVRRVEIPLHSTPATWSSATGALGLLMDANREAAQATTPAHVKIGWPVTLCHGYTKTSTYDSSFNAIFGVSWDSANTDPFTSFLIARDNVGLTLTANLNHGGTNLNLGANLGTTPALGAHNNYAWILDQGSQELWRDGELRVTNDNALSGGDPTFDSTSLITFGDGVRSARHPHGVVDYGYILSGFPNQHQAKMITLDPLGPFTMREDLIGFVAAVGGATSLIIPRSVIYNFLGR